MCTLALVLAAGFALLVSCAGGESRARMPDALSGEGLGGSPWQRGTVEAIAADAQPEALRKLAVQSGKQAVFTQGERTVAVRVFEMPSGTAAFEAVQTYPREADEYYFQMGASFVVVQAKALKPEERRPFLLAFQAAAMPDDSSSQER